MRFLALNEHISQFGVPEIFLLKYDESFERSQSCFFQWEMPTRSSVFWLMCSCKTHRLLGPSLHKYSTFLHPGVQSPNVISSWTSTNLAEDVHLSPLGGRTYKAWVRLFWFTLSCWNGCESFAESGISQNFDNFSLAFASVVTELTEFAGTCFQSATEIFLWIKLKLQRNHGEESVKLKNDHCTALWTFSHLSPYQTGTWGQRGPHQALASTELEVFSIHWLLCDGQFSKRGWWRWVTKTREDPPKAMRVTNWSPWMFCDCFWEQDKITCFFNFPWSSLEVALANYSAAISFNRRHTPRPSTCNWEVWPPPLAVWAFNLEFTFSVKLMVQISPAFLSPWNCFELCSVIQSGESIWPKEHPELLWCGFVKPQERFLDRDTHVHCWQVCTFRHTHTRTQHNVTNTQSANEKNLFYFSTLLNVCSVEHRVRNLYKAFLFFVNEIGRHQHRSCLPKYCASDAHWSLRLFLGGAILVTQCSVHLQMCFSRFFFFAITVLGKPWTIESNNRFRCRVDRSQFYCIDRRRPRGIFHLDWLVCFLCNGFLFGDFATLGLSRSLLDMVVGQCLLTSRCWSSACFHRGERPGSRIQTGVFGLFICYRRQVSELGESVLIDGLRYLQVFGRSRWGSFVDSRCLSQWLGRSLRLQVVISSVKTRRVLF